MVFTRTVTYLQSNRFRLPDGLYTSYVFKHKKSPREGTFYAAKLFAAGNTLKGSNDTAPPEVRERHRCKELSHVD